MSGRSRTTALVAGFALVGSLCVATPAAAQDESRSVDLFASWEKAPEQELKAARGKAHTIDIDALLDATLTDNDFTGAVLIDPALVVTPLNDISGSFDNVSGIVTVIQNTGSGVIIQSATIVTVNFLP